MPDNALSLKDLFIKTAKNASLHQRSDGSMQAGHNGPHKDPETPVRNTSHWLIAYIKAFLLTEEAIFENAAEKCLDYLLKKDTRPNGYTFSHRTNPAKDFSNGIIGQAWTIEALIYAYHHFKDENIIQLAEQVFKLHRYDDDMHAWQICEIDGKNKGFDKTYNHQLWFASIGCELVEAGVPSVKKNVLDFIQNICKFMELYKNGVVKHHPYSFLRTKTFRFYLGAISHKVKSALRPYDAYYAHSAGYHGFNTYALHVISEFCKKNRVPVTFPLDKALYVFSDDHFRHVILHAPFGYSYNPPGIEAAVSVQSLNDDAAIRPLQEYWLKQQFQNSFDFQLFQMNKRTPDPCTLNARMYELYRLSNFDISVSIHDNQRVNEN